MNFLAHLYLADNTPDSLIGNMLGDFVTPETELKFSTPIRNGISLHRAVDKFTDHHPIFLRSKGRISDDFRLLKGVMVDIFYDHFLAKNWPDYADIPLEDFAKNVYQTFSAHRDILPARMLRMLPVMIRGNWLVSYREMRGIAWVLKGMSGRLSFPNNLADGIGELRRNYADFDADFRLFFQELRRFVADEKIKSDFGKTD